MTAAQALTSALMTSSPSSRSSDSRRSDSGDTSFRDTLDSASRSSDQTKSERPSRLSTSGKGSKSDNSSRDDRESKTSGESQDDSAQRTDQTSAAELSLMIAALGGSAQVSDDTNAFAVSDDAQAGAAVPAIDVSDTSDARPWMPGQVDEGEQDLDASQLLALLKSSATSGSEQPNDVTRVDIKATVVAQETHLAVDGPLPDALAALPAPQPEADAAVVPESEGDASLNAAMSKVAADSSETTPVRSRTDTQSGDVKADADAAGARRVAPVTAEGSRGAAFAGPNIAGHDGGQQDGRSSSGSNSQQQNSGVFASLVNGTSNARAAEAPQSAETFEPLSDQIAREVRAELRADGVGESSSDGVVKVLQIELKPANLGSVTVRLALKDNAISVHLETQRRDTLAVIERERDALVSALSSQGYSVDGITTASQSDASRLSTSIGFGDNGSSGAQGGMQGQANQGQGLGNSSGGEGRSGQSQPGNDAYRSPSDGKDDSARGIRSGGDGLYV